MNHSSITRALSLSGLTLLGLAAQSLATVRTSSPALDLKADLFTVPNNGGIPTTSTWITVWGSPYTSPSWGAPASIYPFPPFPPGGAPFGFAINTFNDYIILSGGGGGTWADSTARYAGAAAYITYDDEATAADNITLTTIYGIDTMPLVPGALSIAGYDPAGAYPLLSDEQITGPSGSVYPSAPGQIVPISTLPSILGAGADLSPFTGDPSLPVWVFQTTLPYAEALPEPASLSTLAVAATTLLATRRRKA